MHLSSLQCQGMVHIIREEQKLFVAMNAIKEVSECIN